MIRNKKGWIKIVEAFIAIGLFAGLLFLVIENDPVREYEREFIEMKQNEILNGIQINNSLRNEVLSISNFDLSSNDSAFSNPLTNYLSDNLFSDLNCYLKVCSTDMSCLLAESSNEEIYAKDVIITSTLDEYSPQRLKMFCLK